MKFMFGSTNNCIATYNFIDTLATCYGQVDTESRHTVVCHVAQENMAHANYVSVLTGTTFSWIRFKV